MAERVMVHLGPPKTGTTYLQSLLWRNQTRLRQHGILVPGRAAFDHNLVATHLRDPRPGGRARRVWHQVLDEIHDWPGTAVLSNEWFALAEAGQPGALVRELYGAEVHVVATARDLAAVAPAAWQERLKLGHSASLDEFLAALDAPGERWSWSTLDPAEVLTRWRDTAPAARTHVVTVPPRGSAPHLLWDRFAAACGIPVGAVALRDMAANESLSAESARVLQLLGRRLRDAVDADEGHWTVQYRWLRRYVGHELLVPRPGRRIGLREKDLVRLRERAERCIATLREREVRVYGDLADVLPGAPPEHAIHPDDVPDEAVLEVAGHLVVDLLAALRQGAER